MQTVSLISLGCSRNQVDSEVILGSLRRSGFKILRDASVGSDICIVNTCAFIDSARSESMEVVAEAVRLKRKGLFGYVVVCGCFPQMYGKAARKYLRGADLLIGSNDFPELPRILHDRIRSSRIKDVITSRLCHIADENSPRILLNLRHYAYVKISEGCSNFCSYCIIPRLRGSYRSRSIDSVVNEVEKIGRSGLTREICLVGQDTTLFGIDRYGKSVFPRLLKKLCGLKNKIRWIRILYTHPAHYSDEFISVMRGERRICRYSDIPVQHISDKILKSMNRRVSSRQVMLLLDKLRHQVPGIALRTSIIVGFPGETEKDFAELLKFVRNARFEKLGAFIYSKESGTKAARMPKQIPENVKQDRFDALMKLQQKISVERNASLVGERLDVLIDEKVEGERCLYAGRTEFDAPEVDGLVYVSGRLLRPGEFRKVKITDSFEYDLAGTA